MKFDADIRGELTVNCMRFSMIVRGSGTHTETRKEEKKK